MKVLFTILIFSFTTISLKAQHTLASRVDSLGNKKYSSNSVPRTTPSVENNIISAVPSQPVDTFWVDPKERMPDSLKIHPRKAPSKTEALESKSN